MGAHEHEHEDDDDDDYVSGTARARAAAAGIIGGWAERDGRRQAPSFLLALWKSERFLFPSAQEDIKWQFELAPPPRPPPTLIDSRARKGQTDRHTGSVLALLGTEGSNFASLFLERQK